VAWRTTAGIQTSPKNVTNVMEFDLQLIVAAIHAGTRGFSGVVTLNFYLADIFFNNGTEFLPEQFRGIV
jgi:hypothetical protein